MISRPPTTRTTQHRLLSLAATMLLTACFSGPGFFQQSGAAFLAGDPNQQIPASIKSEADGVLTAALSATSSVTQVVSASAASALAGSELAFPPGAVAIDTDITIEDGANLAAPSTLAELGISASQAVSAASGTLVISSTIAIDTSVPFTITIPFSASASLLEGSSERLAILYKVQKVALGGGYFVGMIPRSRIRINGNKASFETSYFGAYQAVYSDVAPESLQEKPTTAVVTKREEASAESTTTASTETPQTPGDAPPTSNTGDGPTPGTNAPNDPTDGPCVTQFNGKWYDPGAFTGNDAIHPSLLAINFGAVQYGDDTTGVVLFRASDNLSGINPWVYLSLKSENSNQYLPVQERVYHIAADQFCVEFKISKYNANGSYFVHQFDLHDRAGNIRHYRSESSSEPVLSEDIGGTLTPTALPLPHVVINTSTPDTTPPNITAISFHAGTYMAGSNAIIQYAAHDTQSGLASVPPCMYLELDPSAAPDQRYFHCASEVITISPGLYQVEFPLNPWLANGMYKLVHFKIRDNINNEAILDASSFYDSTFMGSPLIPPFMNVSSGLNDLTPPSLAEIYAVSSSVQRGQLLELNLMITDEGSGLETMQWCIEIADTATNTPLINMCGYEPLTPQGANLYLARVPIPIAAATGDYFVRSIELRDLAGNQVHYIADGAQEFYLGGSASVASFMIDP